MTVPGKRVHIDVDKKLIDKLMLKYGFSYDAFILFIRPQKVPLELIRQVFDGVADKACLRIYRECTIEEYVEKSFSGYMRRFVRMPRKLIYDHYERVYGDIYTNAHKAVIGDRPNIPVEEEKVLVEIKGGHVDFDSLSAPGYISIQKIPIKENMVLIRIICNSMLHKYWWTGFLDINFHVGVILTKLLHCEGFYGRATSMSLRSELLARAAYGKVKEMVSEKKVLENELEQNGLTINTVLDICDTKVGIKCAEFELRNIAKAFRDLFESLGIGYLYPEMVKAIETKVIPVVKEKDAFPSFRSTITFCRDFLLDKLKDDKSIADLILEGGEKVEDTLLEVAGSIAKCLLAYVRYYTYLEQTSDAEIGYYVLEPTRGRNAFIEHYERMTGKTTLSEAVTA